MRTYEAKWRSTLRNDQRKASSLVLADWLIDRSQTKRIGVEFSSFPEHLSRLFENVERVDLEPFLLQCRRRKDPDERARLQVAIDATGRMYEVARSLVEPGITELEVFSKLQQAAVGICGEPLTETGNDYACGVRGGPARSRRCEAGELYILDLGPAFQGYFADNARTLSVDRQPTDEQFTAWKYVTSALTIVEPHWSRWRELSGNISGGFRLASDSPCRHMVEPPWAWNWSVSSRNTTFKPKLG